MFVIAPLSRCATPAKCEIFLEHISRIARVTKNDESKCRGYAWFRSAKDNDEAQHHWLRGFEIYDEVEANVIAHRSSAEYKAFRKAVGDEKLLEQPSDLRFWRPADIGFLTRNSPMNFMNDQAHSSRYIVVNEITPGPGKGDIILELLSRIALKADNVEQVLSFWVLCREDENDPALLVFSCYLDKETEAAFNAQAAVQGAWVMAYSLSGERRRTTWIDSGIGFLNR